MKIKGQEQQKIIAPTILFVLFFILIFMAYQTSLIYTTINLPLKYSGLNESDIINYTWNGTSPLYVSSGLTLQPFPVCKTTGGLDAIFWPVACTFNTIGWFIQFTGLSTNLWYLTPLLIVMGALIIYVAARLVRGGG